MEDIYKDFISHEVRIQMLERLSVKIDSHLKLATLIFSGIMGALVIPVVWYALTRS